MKMNPKMKVVTYQSPAKDRALLIAAAPDLLAACQRVAAEAHIQIEQDSPESEWPNVEITLTTLKAIWAAIDKAEKK